MLSACFAFGVLVSIHAPTGGATRAMSSAITALAFQFTRPRGARHGVRTCTHWRSVFQFTRPRGARRRRRRGASPWRRFNSRAHGGRDLTDPSSFPVQSRFNSRAHGGRDRAGWVRTSTAYVSIHAPTGGATGHAVSAFGFKEFQFTRPRGARHNMRIDHHWVDGVSIHAPTGGATLISPGEGPLFDVSIHAPTGGATSTILFCRPGAKFQFTRPRGARP